MERFDLLVPALALAASFAIALIAYGVLRLADRVRPAANVKHNQVLGPFFAGFLAWLLGPLERALAGRVSPNAITGVSLVLCAATGVAIALGRLPVGVWLYAVAGILDVLDGRLARRAGTPTAAGALFDSVSDRWGELCVFTGYAWLLHDSPWLLAVMAAIAGSMMVSYTRARAEGLGLAITGGIMQRAERIVLVTGGTLIAASLGHGAAVADIVGVTLLVCGLGSIATALQRWRLAFRVLALRGRPPAIVPLARPAVPPVVTPERREPAARAG